MDLRLQTLSLYVKIGTDVVTMYPDIDTWGDTYVCGRITRPADHASAAV